MQKDRQFRQKLPALIAEKSVRVVDGQSVVAGELEYVLEELASAA